MGPNWSEMADFLRVTTHYCRKAIQSSPTLRHPFSKATDESDYSARARRRWSSQEIVRLTQLVDEEKDRVKKLSAKSRKRESINWLRVGESLGRSASACMHFNALLPQRHQFRSGRFSTDEDRMILKQWQIHGMRIQDYDLHTNVRNSKSIQSRLMILFSHFKNESGKIGHTLCNELGITWDAVESSLLPRHKKYIK